MRYSRLDLTTGERFEAPRDEELLQMFDEIWISESYRPAGSTDASALTLVDVGANVGLFTVWAARRLHAERIIAVEPAPDTASALMANLTRNKVENVTVLQLALGGHRGDATLYRRGAGARDTLFTSDLYGSCFVPLSRTKLITLDDLFSTLEIEHCDLLKLDCEGAEYDILAGASGESLQKIRHIVGEYHVGMATYEPRELMLLMTRAGFRVRCFPAMDVEGGHFHAVRRA